MRARAPTRQTLAATRGAYAAHGCVTVDGRQNRCRCDGCGAGHHVLECEQRTLLEGRSWLSSPIKWSPGARKWVAEAGLQAALNPTRRTSMGMCVARRIAITAPTSRSYITVFYDRPHARGTSNLGRKQVAGSRHMLVQCHHVFFAERQVFWFVLNHRIHLRWWIKENF